MSKKPPPINDRCTKALKDYKATKHLAALAYKAVGDVVSQTHLRCDVDQEQRIKYIKLLHLLEAALAEPDPLLQALQQMAQVTSQ